MQVKTILNSIEKYKGFVYTDVRWGKGKAQKELEILVSPRKNSKAQCSGCGQKRPGYDRQAPRRTEYVPLWGIRVFFVYAMRRVNCPQCGVVVEQVPRSSGKYLLNASNRTQRAFC